MDELIRLLKAVEDSSDRAGLVDVADRDEWRALRQRVRAGTVTFAELSLLVWFLMGRTLR